MTNLNGMVHRRHPYGSVLVSVILSAAGASRLYADSTPPACPLSCERRLEGADALSAASDEVRKKVERYYDEISTKGTRWWGGHALRYGSAAAAGAVTAGGGMAWGAAAAGGALLSNDIGNYLVESHHEAVTKDLLIMANQEMRGALFEKDENGVSRVNLETLEETGALDFLLSDEFYASIDSEYREALTFVRENLRIELLKDVARDVRITAEDVSASRATVVATHQAVVRNEEYMKRLLATQQVHTAAIDGLVVASNSALRELELLEAAAMQQLSPRQKLTLQQQGMLLLTAAEQAAYENTVLAEDIAETGKHFGAALSGIANLPGLSPKARRDINRANQLVNIGVACSTAYLTADPMSFMSAIGGIAGALGGGGKPSAEAQLLHAVLERLAAIERKMDQYHQEEMQALEQINENLFRVQDAILRQMRETQLLVLDSRRAIGELLRDDLEACDTLLLRYGQSVQGLDQVSQESFNAFFESDPRVYGRFFEDCRTGIRRRASDPNISSIFTPLSPSNVNQNLVEDYVKERLFVQTVLGPTRSFYQRHGLAEEMVLRGLMVHVPTMSVLKDRIAREPSPGGSLPVPGALLAIQEGGYRLLDPLEVITTGATARTILEMVPSFYRTDNGDIRPITREIVASCEGKSQVDCPILPATEASRQLHDFAQLLSWLLLQENLVAGLPAIELVAQELEGKLTEDAARFDTRESAEEHQELLSYSSLKAAAVADGDLKIPRCDTGNTTLDSACIMQANPLLAQNGLVFFVANRVGASKKRLVAYSAALEWEDAKPLQDILGPDVVLRNAALDLPNTTEGIELQRKPRWAILLPRLFAYTDSDTDEAPETCWDDPEGGVLRVSSKMKWSDLPIRRKEYMRCYLLPLGETVAALSVTTRPFVADADLERRALLATIRAITSTPSTSHPQTPN